MNIFTQSLIYICSTSNKTVAKVGSRRHAALGSRLNLGSFSFKRYANRRCGSASFFAAVYLASQDCLRWHFKLSVKGIRLDRESAFAWRLLVSIAKGSK